MGRRHRLLRRTRCITWGREDEAMRAAARNIRAWMGEKRGRASTRWSSTPADCGDDGEGLRACFRNDPLAGDAAGGFRVAKGRLGGARRPDAGPRGRQGAARFRVTYHAALSLQHGQQIKGAPEGASEGGGVSPSPNLPIFSHLCLRLGGHLQPHAAGNLERAEGPQGSEPSRRRGRK